MFTLSAEQRAKLAEWMTGRGVVTPENAGASGGVFTYSFTPTALGVVVKVRDGRDGAEVDLTDYSSS